MKKFKSLIPVNENKKKKKGFSRRFPRKAIISSTEHFIFLKRWFKNPRQIGAIAPSSRKLGALIGQHASVDEHKYVVELGGGTGKLTEALLKAGVPADRLYVIELDKKLVGYLNKRFPQINVVHGSACDLHEILPNEVTGNISCIVSGLPMRNMKSSIRNAIVQSSLKVMDLNGKFLQYTYTPISPIPAEKFGLKKRRVGRILGNLPPAAVWCYERL
ncbi:MAG: phospholipid methyltransferase [Alphaproteobacteria bacterium]|jgi:phosphatidylethanolamine/phosphatidyl-N-methylethanolamine N-methyltransferase|nr:phospholipid methyltransferase [Alphaproteobacteria bacterium]MBT5654654.1 phospholipid methyltransferase [Alphaproteobacteria bacterium]